MTPRATAHPSRLTTLVGTLRKQHGKVAEPPFRDPYRLILLEQVAYLTDDATRIAAFRMLEELVGTNPEAIVGAPMVTLQRVTRAGGPIAFELRAKRLKFVAQRVLDEWDGNLDPVLKRPYDEARRELMRYPTIGKPGAERLMLLGGAYPKLALDSNAMRVLLRLGYGIDRGAYAKTYDDVQAAAEREIPATISARRTAHLVLRTHGKTLCRTSKPQCVTCAVRADCPTGRTIVRQTEKKT